MRFVTTYGIQGSEREIMTGMIANQMKKSYVNWNRDSVENKLIFKQLEQLSNGKLSLPKDTELASVSVLKKGNNNRQRYGHFCSLVLSWLDWVVVLTIPRRMR